MDEDVGGLGGCGEVGGRVGNDSGRGFGRKGGESQWGRGLVFGEGTSRDG